MNVLASAASGLQPIPIEEEAKKINIKFVDNAGTTFIFDLIDVPADGNCMYYAMMKALNGVDCGEYDDDDIHEAAMDLREDLAGFLLSDLKVNTPDMFKNLERLILDGFAPTSRQDYNVKTLQDWEQLQLGARDVKADVLPEKYWGMEHDLCLFCLFHNVNIVVIPNVHAGFRGLDMKLALQIYNIPLEERFTIHLYHHIAGCPRVPGESNQLNHYGALVEIPFPSDVTEFAPMRGSIMYCNLRGGNGEIDRIVEIDSDSSVESEKDNAKNDDSSVESEKDNAKNDDNEDGCTGMYENAEGLRRSSRIRHGTNSDAGSKKSQKNDKKPEEKKKNSKKDGKKKSTTNKKIKSSKSEDKKSKSVDKKSNKRSASPPKRDTKRPKTNPGPKKGKQPAKKGTKYSLPIHQDLPKRKQDKGEPGQLEGVLNKRNRRILKTVARRVRNVHGNDMKTKKGWPVFDGAYITFNGFKPNKGGKPKRPNTNSHSRCLGKKRNKIQINVMSADNEAKRRINRMLGLDHLDRRAYDVFETTNIQRFYERHMAEEDADKNSSDKNSSDSETTDSEDDSF